MCLVLGQDSNSVPGLCIMRTCYVLETVSVLDSTLYLNYQPHVNQFIYPTALIHKCICVTCPVLVCYVCQVGQSGQNWKSTITSSLQLSYKSSRSVRFVVSYILYFERLTRKLCLSHRVVSFVLIIFHQIHRGFCWNSHITPEGVIWALV
jgi:hypothetical protein